MTSILNLRRPLSLTLLIVVSSGTAGAQQFRAGTELKGSLAKAAIENRIQSIHPLPPANPSDPTPGKYIFERAAARSQLLQARIKAAAATGIQTRSQATPPSTYPGIQFRPSLPAGDMTDAVVTGDFNRDGKMDFIVANAATSDLWIYLGNGDGTFQLPRVIPLTKGLTPVYLATADLRGNGILDLIVAEFDSDSIGVLLGNGDGSFGIETEYALPEAPSALVIDDFNHDGKLDIAAVMVTVIPPTQPGVQYLAALLGDGTGSFGSPVITMNAGFYSTALSISSGDVNGDGLPDLLVTGPALENSQIYLNSGNGTFAPGPVVVENGQFNALQAGQLVDINGDGCLDVVDADANGFVWIYTGDCSGNFTFDTSVPMGDSNATLVVQDINGDGLPDIVTTTFPGLWGIVQGDVAGNMLAVAFGDGKGSFTSGRDYVGAGESYSLAIADFNGDDHPDVVSASPDTNTATVWINDGSGGFGFPQGEWAGVRNLINNPISGPSFADVNGDGKPDLLFLNEGYGGEYWITSLLNDGTGRFSAPVESDAGVSITTNWIGDYRLGDFRATGHLDFLGIGLGMNFTTGTQFILFVPGNGDGTFGTPTVTQAPGADGNLAVGDFNNDGKLDFAAISGNANGVGWNLNVFLGNGNGTFHPGQTLSFTDSAEVVAGVYVGDFNRDGKLDIVVFDTANGYWTTASSVWEFFGNGDGTFQPGHEIFTNFQPMTMADVNGDSLLDIIRYDFLWPGTTNAYGPAKFTTYLDQPSGAFSQSSSYAPYAGTPLSILPYEFGDPLTSSWVADLNGDGKPDEVAFQSVNQGYGDNYAQVLSGNGDGTFTPTYDVFDFQKNFSVPRYAHPLEGSATSDLVEIDSASSSVSVFKGGSAPPFQLQLEQTQVTGNSGCGWVFLNLPSNADTTIILSSSISGVDLPASVTVPAGLLEEQFCYSLAAGYDWHQVFDVRAQLGSYVAVAYASQAVTFGFSEVISASGYQYVYPTQSTVPIAVSLTSLQGYSSTVQLSCEGLLAGESCSFESDTLQVSPGVVATTTVVVNTSAATPTQITSTIVIVASDANVTARQSFNLSVLSLVLYPTGGPIQASSPGSASVNGITILGIPPYSPSCLGLPAGVTCSFTQTVSANPNSDSFINMNVSIASGVAAGSYPFTFQVVSGPETAKAAFTLNIGDFSVVLPTPANAWAVPGQAIDLGVTLQAIGNLQGSVNVTCAINFGGTCVGGQGFIGQQLTLTITVPSGIPVGSYTLTVTATDSSIALTHTATLLFYVVNFSGTISPASIQIPPGENGSVTATVNATAGFNGTVTFACSGATQLSCTFSPSTLQPSQSSPQSTTLTISVPSYLSLTPAPGGTPRLTFVIVLCIAFMMGCASFRNRHVPALHSALVLLSFSLIFVAASCGGGGGSQGGGGTPSQTFAIGVTATLNGSNITRALGTVDVTVNQNP